MEKTVTRNFLRGRFHPGRARDGRVLCSWYLQRKKKSAEWAICRYANKKIIAIHINNLELPTAFTLHRNTLTIPTQSSQGTDYDLHFTDEKTKAQES